MRFWYLRIYVSSYVSRLWTNTFKNCCLFLRYIKYFSGLLSGSLRISQSPLYLTHLTVLGVPLFEPTGCRAFLKVYEGLNPVYTSDLYSVTNAREFTVNLGGLRLRGDILVKCYHRVYSKQSREVMFSLQVRPTEQPNFPNYLSNNHTSFTLYILIFISNFSFP